MVVSHTLISWNRRQPSDASFPSRLPHCASSPYKLPLLYECAGRRHKGIASRAFAGIGCEPGDVHSNARCVRRVIDLFARIHAVCVPARPSVASPVCLHVVMTTAHARTSWPPRHHHYSATDERSSILIASETDFLVCRPYHRFIVSVYEISIEHTNITRF